MQMQTAEAATRVIAAIAAALTAASSSCKQQLQAAAASSSCKQQLQAAAASSSCKQQLQAAAASNCKQQLQAAALQPQLLCNRSCYCSYLHSCHAGTKATATAFAIRCISSCLT